MKLNFNLFIDMDGTLVNLNAKEYKNFQEEAKQPGFFLNLEPLPFLDEINKFAAVCPENIFILSACMPSIYCIPEKIEWLKKYLPNACKENVLFAQPGEEKSRLARKKLNHPLTDLDLLIDDYSKNLEEWENAGGTSIKFQNYFNTANPEKYKYLIKNFSELSNILVKIRQNCED